MFPIINIRDNMEVPVQEIDFKKIRINFKRPIRWSRSVNRTAPLNQSVWKVETPTNEYAETEDKLREWLIA